MSKPLSHDPGDAPVEEFTVRASDSREATVILTDGLPLAVLFGPQSTRDAWRDVILADLDPHGVEVIERVGARGLWPIVKGATT